MLRGYVRPPGDESEASLSRPAITEQRKFPHGSLHLDCAQGCLLGQLAGNNLGALVEFKPRPKSPMPTPNLEDKFVGGLIGTALGDAVGQRSFGLFDRAMLETRVGSLEDLYYTDDTAMALGITQVLVAEGELEPERLGRQFHENYKREPWRGYAEGPPELFAMVEREKLSYRDAATRLYGARFIWQWRCDARCPGRSVLR